MSGRTGRLSLRGSVGWFALAYAGAIAGYLAVNAFAARLLDDEFGYFVIAVTVSTLLGQLGLIGVHRGGLREAARLGPDDTEGLRDLRRGVRAVALVTLPLTSAVTAVVTFCVLDEAGTGSRWAVSVGMGVLVWLSGQQKLWANYLRGFGEVRFASLLEGRSGGMLVSAAQGVLVGVVLLFFAGLGLAGALAALALGYAVPVVLAWRRVARRWSHVRGGGSALRDLRVVARRHWRFTSTMLGGYLNSTVEIWIAGLVLSTFDTSLFSAAQRLSILLSIPLVSFGVVFSPVVARLAGNDDVRLERLLRSGASVAALVTAVAWVPMLLVPGPVLGLVFGPTFAAAAPTLVFLTVGSVANVLTGMCGTALSMSRHEGVTAMVQWLALAVRVPAGLLAVALLGGAAGLGASAAAVTTAMYVALWLLARRRTGLRTHLTFRPSLRLMRETAG